MERGMFLESGREVNKKSARKSHVKIVASLAYARSQSEVRYALFRTFDLLGDQCNADPSVICPQAVEESQRNVARFGCGAVKAGAQVLHFALVQLLDAAQYDNQTGDHLSNAAEIVDGHKQFHASDVDVRHDAWLELCANMVIFIIWVNEGMDSVG